MGEEDLTGKTGIDEGGDSLPGPILGGEDGVVEDQEDVSGFTSECRAVADGLGLLESADHAKLREAVVSTVPGDPELVAYATALTEGVPQDDTLAQDRREIAHSLLMCALYLERGDREAALEAIESADDLAYGMRTYEGMDTVLQRVSELRSKFDL